MEPPGPEMISGSALGRAGMRWAVLFYAAMAGLAWALRGGWGRQSVLYATPEAAEAGIRWASDTALGVAAGIAGIGISRLVTRRTGAGERLARALAGALGSLSPGQCLVLAVASAAGEEALFRGALQPSLGLLGASAVFGAVHFAPRRDLWPWSVYAFGAGVVLGVLFESTGNLLAPVVAHATLNGVNLRFLVREYGGSPRDRTEIDPVNPPQR